MPYPSLLHPEPLSLQQTTTDQYLHRRCSNTVLSQSCARRSNQSILKEISPEYSLEGLMLKLKLQCFGHLIGKDSDLGKTEGKGRG